MRIGINSALIGEGEGFRRAGVSRYVSELVDALPDVIGADDHLVRIGGGHDRLLRRAPGRIAWEQTGLPWRAHRERLDVLHSPVNVAPLARTCPSVITVHDLAFLRYPEHLSPRRRAWLRTAIRVSALRADRVIAVSTSTARDLADWTGLSLADIDVVPSAPSPRIQPLDADGIRGFRAGRGLSAPYILAVGTLEPRKNLPTLLRAFAKVKDTIRHDLVLVGPEGWLTEELHQTVSALHLGDRLRMTGFVPDSELGGWYSGASLFAFPSLYEGFGLPALEAMRCGAPVLASDSSSFPEVVGDAGVLVSPHDVDAWSEAMWRLLQDPARLEDLSQRGRQRADQFSWARTARETYDVYLSLLGG